MSHYNIISHMIFWAHFPISRLGDSFIPFAFFVLLFYSCSFWRKKILNFDIGICMRRFKLKKTLNLIHQFTSNSALFFYISFFLLPACFSFHLDISWLCVYVCVFSMPTTVAQALIHEQKRKERKNRKVADVNKKKFSRKRIYVRIWRMAGTTKRDGMNRGA